MPEQLHLMRPEWLWLLAPAALLALGLWLQGRRAGSWNDVIAPELLKHLVGDADSGSQRSLLPLLLLGWVIAAVAATGPSWKQIPQPVHQKQDALVLVLDLSYSMKAADLAPSRMDRARQKLVDLLQQRDEGQTGMIAYAGDAHIVTPLTDDFRTISNLLPALNPDMMPVPGSEPADAIAMAIELLKATGIVGGRILLVSDGISAADRKRISRQLEGSGVELSILGVGTSAGAPIPLPRGGFLKDSNGTIVMPSLEEAPLRGLAADTGGRYREMSVGNDDLETLLAESPLAGSAQTLALDRSADTWEDQGYWFAILLIPFLLPLFRRGVLPGLLLLGLLLPGESRAETGWLGLWQTPDQQGRSAMERGDFEQAAELFENPAWAGTASYEAGDYEAAVERFAGEKSADAHYNRGNALARSGQFDEAIEAYRETLALQPDSEDAKANIELLEKLKEQQEQQQQQQNQDEQQEENQQNEGQQDQDRQQQEPSGDDQEQQDDSSQEPQGGQGEEPSGDSDPERDQQEEPGESEGPSEEDSKQEEEQSKQQPQAEEPGESSEQPVQAEPAPEDAELDQAMEQWLRRVPDDPSGLLREKFRYESQLRSEQGEQRKNETYW